VLGLEFNALKLRVMGPVTRAYSELARVYSEAPNRGICFPQFGVAFFRLSLAKFMFGSEGNAAFACYFFLLLLFVYVANESMDLLVSCCGEDGLGRFLDHDSCTAQEKQPFVLPTCEAPS